MEPVFDEVMVKVPVPYLLIVPKRMPEPTVRAGEPRTKSPLPTNESVERFVRLL